MAQYNQQPVAQPNYQQPAPPANMAFQNNGSNQQLNEKAHNHGAANGQWSFGFWDCFSPSNTCCLAYWCPCILFGKTQDRNQGDPNSSGLGMMCCAWYCTAHCGAQAILQAIQRHSYRKQHGIEGSGLMDCLGAWCCPCCGLVQEEKESLLRSTGIDPVTKQQYQAPQGMMA